MGLWERVTGWLPDLGGDGTSLQDGASDPPQAVTISYDRLRLLVREHITKIEDSNKWIAYLAIALSMFAAVATGDFSFTTSKLGLDGRQWQLLFVIVGAYALARSALVVRQWVTRPSPDALIRQILEASEYNREDRAILLLKHHDQPIGYRVLVYWDLLWECYLLPHYNLKGLNPGSTDDHDLAAFISSFIGCDAGSVGVSYVAGCDLRSRKLSEFYRQDTAYSFSFYHVQIRSIDAVPAHLLSLSFSYSGRKYAWLTPSEMEADEKTRRRNIDMTRHLADYEHRLLSQTPPSLPPGANLTEERT